MTLRAVLRAARTPGVAIAMAVLTASTAGAALVPVNTSVHAPVRTRWSSTATPTPTWKRPAAARPTVPTRASGTARLIHVGVDYEPPVTDASRRRIAGSCVPGGPGGPDYSLEGWKVPASLTVHFNPAGTPAGVPSPAGGFQAEFNAWAAAGAPSVTVASDGTATSPRADGVDELMFANLGARTLGITYTWQWSNGVVESDVVFSRNAPWFQASAEGNGCYPSANAYDIQNVAAHEFGHLLGLGHTQDRFNTMYPSAALGETFKRSPAQGDANGMHAIYG